MNSTYWVNQVMNTMYVNGGTEFWVGLSSTEPNRDGSNVTEPTGDDYARVQVTAFSEAVDGYVQNVDDIEFPKSTSVWFPAEAKATHWVLFDGAGADANLLSSGELLEAKTIETSTRVTLAAETLGITLLDYEPELA